MMRRVLAAGLLLLLAAGAGCTAFGGGSVDPDRLAREAEYDWDTDANVTVTVEKGANVYEAVYRIDGQEALEVSRFEELSGDRPLDVSAVYFRHPNGTVVNLGPEAVTKTRSATVISLPADEGRLALSAPKRGKHVQVAAVLGAPYEVILPRGAEVRYPLLSRVVPRTYERSIEDRRVHLRWEEARGDRIVVRYYLGTDFLIFGGLLAGGAIAAIGGVVYFYYQLRDLRRAREEVAWDGES